MKRNFIEYVGLKANGSNLMTVNFGTLIFEILVFLKILLKKN